MSQSQTLIDPLTAKEQEVMELYSNPFLEKREIMARLSISLHTLNHHITNAFDKLGEADRFAASWRFWLAYPECRRRVAEEIERAIREAA
jgi:ATP/maltotriose-dependent transcriptional regulator MalT